MIFTLDDLVYVTGGKHKGRIGQYKGSREDAHLLQFFNCKAVVYKGYVQAANEKQKASYLKRATNSAIIPKDWKPVVSGRIDCAKPNLSPVPRQPAPFEGVNREGNDVVRQLGPTTIIEATAGLTDDPGHVLESGETLSEALINTGITHSEESSNELQ